jgi:hypothetical protein
MTVTTHAPPDGTGLIIDKAVAKALGNIAIFQSQMSQWTTYFALGKCPVDGSLAEGCHECQNGRVWEIDLENPRPPHRPQFMATLHAFSEMVALQFQKAGVNMEEVDG